MMPDQVHVVGWPKCSAQQMRHRHCTAQRITGEQ
jgi:hypothetical protein